MSNGTRMHEKIKTALDNATDVLRGLGVEVVTAAGPIGDLFPDLDGRLASAQGVLVDLLGAEPTLYLAPGLDTETAAEIVDLAWSPVAAPAGHPWIGGANGARYLPL